MKVKYVFKYASDFITSTFAKIFFKKPKVMTDEETINYILTNHCSICRFGDGELRLIRGIDLEFQNYNKELSKKLKKSCVSKPSCIACIPAIFNKATFNENTFSNYDYGYWRRFIFYRGGLWHYYFRKSSCIGDAYISRFYMERNHANFDVANYVKKLKTLWQDRNIVFIEGKQSRLGVGNDLFDNAKSIKRILCPALNAFSVYNEIKESIIKNCNKDDLLILALGPTATVLAYELSKQFQCLDMGHVDIEYMWFKMKASKKVPVPGKFTNEAEGGRNPEDVTDKEYLSQIIEIIE